MEVLNQSTKPQNAQIDTIRNYYQLHAKLYQATRWSFLFGRKQIVQALQLPMFTDKTILEVGCGTGHNLSYLVNHYPNVHVIGLDISPDMLKVAAKQLRAHTRRMLLLERPYGSATWKLPAQPDIILFSYCLTMINPGWEDALNRAFDDLKEGGLVAVVDFHDTPRPYFQRWMAYNHVRMDNHLLPALKKLFNPIHLEVKQAYGGLWSYFLFVGKK